MSWLFFKGLIIGFVIAAPVGPVNVLCIKRTVLHGRLVGIVSGVGAALADTLFGAIAAFGLYFVQALLEAERLWLALGGAVFLLIAGVKALNAEPPQPSPAPDPSGLVGDLTSTFLLTLTNPITVLSFLAVFAAFGVSADTHIDAADWLLLSGVFLGSSAWWATLVAVAGCFHGKFAPENLRWVNRGAGVVMLVFAAFVLWKATTLAG